MDKKLIYFILAGIVIFGVFLRVFYLGMPPMWFDETISAVASSEILEKGVPRFDSGLFYSRALVFHYIQAFFLIFSKSDFAVRLVSVLFGALTIVLGYFIGKEYDKTTGIVAALFCAVLSLEIFYSQQARFYQMFQFFFFLTFFLLYKSGKGERKKLYAWLALVSLVILVNTHIAGLIAVPFFFVLFFREQKDWKLFIIPSLVSLYYLKGFLGISYGDSGLALSYAEEYSLQIYQSLKAFILISVIGMYFAFRKNMKLSLLILLPSFILLIGLFFVKVFAMRYLYFFVFPIIVFSSLAFAETRKLGKWVFILAVVFAVVYPSNIFFSGTSFTTLIPENRIKYDATEPVIDYKSLSDNTIDLANEKVIVSLSSPGVAWYLRNPEYVIPFSLNGLKTGFALHNGRDSYTGAEVFDYSIRDALFFEDAFGYSKLSDVEREKLESWKENCLLIDETINLRVYECSS